MIRGITGTMRQLVRTRFLSLLLAVLVFAVPLLSVFTTPAHANGGLELVRDRTATLLPSAAEVPHEVYFVVSPDGQQIRPTDYIVYDFVNYPLVDISSAATLGGYGTPTITKVGTQVRITNIAILPGGSFMLYNIFTTNPPSGVGNQVILSISENADGSSPRNQVTIIPTDSSFSISVSATIISPMAAGTFSGFTSASAFVTLIEGSSVLATTVANLAGAFTFNLTGLAPGAHSFQIYSTDFANRSTAPTTLNLFMLANTLTSATNILLSSSIALTPSEIDVGEPITFLGSAKPDSQINIFVEAPLRSYIATTNSSGEWTYTMNSNETGALSPGEYQVYTVVQDSLGAQSVVSPTLNFTVKAPSGDSNPDPACDISRADLNCNGTVNLVDFSILLFHWNTNHKVADINADGSVNLIDFSIMMFYYSG